jgi:hypothetical protein
MCCNVKSEKAAQGRSGSTNKGGILVLKPSESFSTQAKLSVSATGFIRITLTPDEAADAIQVGTERQRLSVLAGLKDKHGFEGDGEYIHIQGAGGELSFCKVLRVPWVPGFNTFKKPDVLGYQVRTRSEPWHELIIRTDDNPAHKYVLVLGIMPMFDVVGWYLGKDARRGEWWHAHGGREPAWFVPQEELHPISDLIAEVRRAQLMT